jgi:ketosteroid isomerase-like protein
MQLSDFDQVIERYHDALREFCLNGNPEPAKELYSHRDDASLGNPFGPYAHGWDQVTKTMERAAANYSDGDMSTFERVAEYGTPDLRYIVEVEHYKTRVAGSQDKGTVALRATTVFRTEDGAWRIVHRHAVPHNYGSATRIGTSRSDAPWPRSLVGPSTAQDKFVHERSSPRLEAALLPLALAGIYVAGSPSGVPCVA